MLTWPSRKLGCFVLLSHLVFHATTFNDWRDSNVPGITEENINKQRSYITEETEEICLS